MIADPRISVAFTGHRTYCGEASDALRQMLEALYDRGFRTFLSGMAVGFDLAAAEAVLELCRQRDGVRLVAAVPFLGQENRFSPADRERFRSVLAAAAETVVLSPVYHRGCYAVRNNYLTDNARVLVAWYVLHRSPCLAPWPGGCQPPSGGSLPVCSRSDAVLKKRRAEARLSCYSAAAAVCGCCTSNKSSLPSSFSIRRRVAVLPYADSS